MITNDLRLLFLILYHGNEFLYTSPLQKLIKIFISAYIKNMIFPCVKAAPKFREVLILKVLCVY
jgi:hypothetical protein